MAVRRIETEIAMTGEREFNDALKSVNNNVKNLKAEMALATAEFKGNEDSLDGLSEKERILSELTEQYSEKVKAMETHLQQVTAAYGEDSAKADEWRRSIISAKAELVKTSKELDSVRKAIEGASKAENADASAAQKATKEKRQYVSVTDKLKSAMTGAKGKITDFAHGVREAARHVPVLAEALDVLTVAGKGTAKTLKVTWEATKKISTVGAAVVGATGAVAVGAAKILISFASGAAQAAQAAADAGEKLSPVQQKWLEYSHTLTNLDESVNAAKAALGGVLLPLLNDMGQEGTQLLFEFSDAMENAAGDPEAMGKVVSKYVVKFAEFIKDALPEIKNIARSFLSGLGEGFDKNSDQILDDAVGIVSDLLDGIIAAAPRIGTGAGQLISKLGTALVSQGPAIIEAGVQLIVGLLTGFTKGLPDILAGIPAILKELGSAFLQIVPAMWDVGVQIVRGLWNGIQSIWSDLTSWVVNSFNNLIGSVRGDQEIHSPSKKWGRMVGAPMAEGVGVDFANSMKSVRRDIEAQLDPSSFNIGGGFDVPAYGSAPGFGGSVSNRTFNGGINIVVNAAPGQSAEEIADEVMTRMQNENETETGVFL